MERKIRFLCPECFWDSGINLINYPKLDFDISKDIEIENEEIKDLHESTGYWVDFHGTCNNCKRQVTFIDIDEGMVDIIQYMNSIGYETVYCCEGHIKDDNNYDYPYLIFDAGWDDKLYFNMIQLLPDSWEIYKTDLNRPNNYRFDSEFRLYCRNPGKYKDYLNDLKHYIYTYFPKLIFNPKNYVGKENIND